MYPCTEYEMTQEDCDELLESMKPMPMIMLHIGGVSSPQDKANSAWQKLAGKMGFVWDSVKPIPGKGMRFFTATPSETDEARTERKAKENEEKKRAHIKRLEENVTRLQQELTDILVTGE